MLPGMDGYRVLRTLREEGIDTPVLILSARGEETDKVLGFHLGADDYVAKPFGLARAARARRRAAAPRVGGRRRKHKLAGAGDVRRRAGRSGDAHGAARAASAVALRPKEYDLLIALLQRRGQVASRAELLEEVWGYSGEVYSRTVDTHVAELRRKLEENAAEPRHILTVRKTGYRIQRLTDDSRSAHAERRHRVRVKITRLHSAIAALVCAGCRRCSARNSASTS